MNQESLTKREYTNNVGQKGITWGLSGSLIHSHARAEAQQQRYRAAYHTAKKLASCAAEVTGQMYDVRLHQMTTML